MTSQVSMDALDLSSTEQATPTNPTLMSANTATGEDDERPEDRDDDAEMMSLESGLTLTSHSHVSRKIFDVVKKIILKFHKIE